MFFRGFHRGSERDCLYGGIITLLLQCKAKVFFHFTLTAASVAHNNEPAEKNKIPAQH